MFGTTQVEIISGAGLYRQTNVPYDFTISPIANGNTWTSDIIECGNFPALCVALKTDRSGLLYIEFSIDQLNWDSILTYNVSPSINEIQPLLVGRKYVRLRFYNNSGFDQTYIRLQLILGSYGVLSAPLNLTLQDDASALTTRPNNYQYEVALGRRQNATTWNKFGYNGDIDIGTETIWNNGGLFARITVAGVLSIVSTSANDTSGGTGANSVIVYGVDENYEDITEVVTLNGTTPVNTVNSFFGVNRISNYLVGSTGFNAGRITATKGTVQGAIEIGEGTTQQAFFFIAENKTALMDWLVINVGRISGAGTQPKVTIKGFVTSLVSNSRYEVFRHTIDTDVENTIQLNPSQPFVVGEKSLIEFQCTTDVNNTVASCRFSFITVQNIFV